MIRDSRAVEPLVLLVRKDQELEVRWSAVLALGELGSPDAIPDIIPLLRDPNRFLRYGAAVALTRLGWQPENETDRVYLLIAWQEWDKVQILGSTALPPLWDLLRDPDPATRAAIVELLGRIGDPKAAGACQRGLRDRDPHVRWRAVLASMDCGLDHHDLPLMVAARERSGPDPAAAALLNFLFLGIGYNYIGKWWGFPVFMSYMSVLVLAQLYLGPFTPYLIAYPVTAVLGIHTFYMTRNMSDL